MYITPAEIELLVDELGIKLDEYKENGMDDEYVHELEMLYSRLVVAMERK